LLSEGLEIKNYILKFMDLVKNKEL